MVEIHEQIIQLCQIKPDSEVQNGAAAALSSPPKEVIPPEVGQLSEHKASLVK
jgi:hypothetical protein